MRDDFFQAPKSDLFQDEFLPGRAIPEHDLTAALSALVERSAQQPTIDFVADVSNKSDWITVIYASASHAEKAAKALPGFGLKVFYPKCRHKAKESQIEFDMQRRKRKDTTNTPALVPAYGRYLFIQLPEDQETLANLEVTERMLGGRFNENGVVKIMSIDGEYSLTQNREILANENFHLEQIEKSNPRTSVRFAKNEVVRVTRGNLAGYFVTVAADIFMYFKLTGKTEVIIENTRARHFVKVGDLEKC
jgi:hypothetical protein